ncbi:hypothetical protein PISL3812_07333 [Talaromyces islandicus]|uniref:Uncharacterized protein n=1 Tax=Talaromyces islandicus TaxID=28573 RepID=A0A0U1M5I2_TALIS|nr:hypothetical protein PISL3812_07333 [Talaromyces islandicus]
MLSENEPGTGSRDQAPQDTHSFGPLSRQHEVEYWKVNPLTSVDNIRRWEQECLDIRNKPETGNNNQNADNTTPTTRRPRRTRSTTISKHHGPVGTNKDPPQNTGQDDDLYNRFQEEQQTSHHSRRYSEEIGDYSQDTTETPPPQPITPALPFDVPNNFDHTKEYTTSTARTTPQLSAWEEAPTINFQKQFLW